MMNITWCTLMINNLEESLHFYQDILKLKIEKRFSLGSKELVFFDTKGDMQIELIYDKEATVERISPGISLGINCGNLNEMIKQLQEHQIEIKQGSIRMANMNCLFIEDPNGLNLQLYELI